MITPNYLDGVALWEILLESVGIQKDQIDELARRRLIRRLIGLEVSDLVYQTNLRIRESNVRSVEELQSLPYPVIGFSEDLHRRNRQLKDFLFTKLYRHYRVVRMAVKAERVLTDLFNAYTSEPSILPQHIQEQINEFGLQRTVCDYLAGMTDRFAIEEHQKIFDLDAKP